jgi:hypothetical protein
MSLAMSCAGLATVPLAESESNDSGHAATEHLRILLLAVHFPRYGHGCRLLVGTATREGGLALVFRLAKGFVCCLLQQGAQTQVDRAGCR